jgi:hypothetical protein
MVRNYWRLHFQFFLSKRFVFARILSFTLIVQFARILPLTLKVQFVGYIACYISSAVFARILPLVLIVQFWDHCLGCFVRAKRARRLKIWSRSQPCDCNHLDNNYHGFNYCDNCYRSYYCDNFYIWLLSTVTIRYLQCLPSPAV